MNRLSKESSPYLKQHQDNPVDWYPWGSEALERARREDKPILLSVGYSACHWCHVMAHESFEDPATAQLMNAHFINIKVDREERPDLDQIYQNVAQIFTRGGGWPLTVWLMPDLKPYFGGTYFPPEDKYGRPGFPRVLLALSDAYKNDRANVVENATKIVESIAQLETVAKPQSEVADLARLDLETLSPAVQRIVDSVDWVNGGFGGAPKFPNTMMLSALWRYAQASSASAAPSELVSDCREAVILSLSRMAMGGIYDQLGGGFSRYSVDEEWAVPHFEKMLYDNALLLKLYAETVLSGEGSTPQLSSTQQKTFMRVLAETVEYLEREMLTAEGTFYAAQDADSEGEEGKFFAWTPEQVRGVLRDCITKYPSLYFGSVAGAESAPGKLGSEDAAFKFAQLRFGIREQGNFEHGTTVLSLPHSSAECAKRLSMTEEQVEAATAAIRKALYESRDQRIKPGLDNKRLTSWNALMVSGLVWASEAFRFTGDSQRAAHTRKLAVSAFEALVARVGRPEGALFAAYHVQDSKTVAHFNAYLDDYAYLAQAALDIARTCDSVTDVGLYSGYAMAWAHRIMGQFKDPEAPAYFFTSHDHEALIQRPKTLYDQAIPAGTSVAIAVMAALAEVAPEKASALGEEARSQMSQLLPALLASPHGSGELLCTAVLFAQGAVAVGGKTRIPFLDARVFRKADAAEIICHRQTCRPSESSTSAVRMRAAITGLV